MLVKTIRLADSIIDEERIRRIRLIHLGTDTTLENQFVIGDFTLKNSIATVASTELHLGEFRIL
jgi:hypothetical protein